MVDSIPVTLVGAGATAAAGYVFGLITDVRKTKLNFVNTQIEKLHGPLYAFTQATNKAWELFCETRWRTGSDQYFDDVDPPTVEEVLTWRHWMKTVFQPLNIQMEETIISNSHFIVGEEMPPEFQALIAHTEAYKAVITKWKDDDFESVPKSSGKKLSVQQCPQLSILLNSSGSNYPSDLKDLVIKHFNFLKQTQELLNRHIFLWWLKRPRRQM